MTQPEPPQNFASHRRLVPGFHIVTFLLFVVYFVYSLVQLLKHPSSAWLVGFGLSVGLILLFFYARLFAVTVQDRVIRLEETLRMQRLLPPELLSRTNELTTKQIVALRFASDAELADLVRWTLDTRPAGTRAIKERITSWRADHLRA